MCDLLFNIKFFISAPDHSRNSLRGPSPNTTPTSPTVTTTPTATIPDRTIRATTYTSPVSTASTDKAKPYGAVPSRNHQL